MALGISFGGNSSRAVAYERFVKAAFSAFWGAGTAQWWERSPPTIMAQARFRPGARFSKAPGTFRARKAKAKSRALQLQSCFIYIFLVWREVHFIQEVSGVYTSPFLHSDQRKMALRARKVSWAFGKRAPGAIRGWVFCWFLPCSDGFLRVLRFSSLHKNHHAKFQLDLGRGSAWKPADVASSLINVILFTYNLPNCSRDRC